MCSYSTYTFIFTLPMRNWNTRKLTVLDDGKTDFYFTYEELKQIIKKIILRRLNYFYFTYEELKPARRGRWSTGRIQFLLYLWGIETGASARVKYKCYKFLLYLWGIETSSQHTYEETSFYKFLLYLWGIETRYLSVLLLVFYFIFTLPMRNWNVGEETLIKSGVLIFTLPMRNWNIVRVILFAMFPFRFLLYLWGIETSGAMLFILPYFLLFLLYLWGIETLF